MKNQFSFLLTLFLLSNFLNKFLLFLPWFLGLTVHPSLIHVIILCSSWVARREIDLEKQWCHFINKLKLTWQYWIIVHTNFNDFSMNQHFLSPLWTMESFTIFTSSAIPLSMTTLCNDWVWLEFASEVQK